MAKISVVSRQKQRETGREKERISRGEGSEEDRNVGSARGVAVRQGGTAE
jgi:hypothetical protein